MTSRGCRGTAGTVSTWLASGLSFAGTLLALPEAGAQQIDLSVPEPKPPEQRTLRVHEGFYFRASVGLGRMGGSVDVGANEVASPGALQLTGDLSLGGSPSPGFVIGGTVLAEVAGLESVFVGPFVDAFPNDRGGWHFGGAAGAVRTGTDSAAGDESALGVGLSAWAGHGVWVAPEWSMGGLVRLTGARAWGDGDVSVARLSATMCLSVLYH